MNSTSSRPGTTSRRAGRIARTVAVLAAATALFSTVSTGSSQAAAADSHLDLNQALSSNQWIASGDARLVMQGDGNLVLYAAQNTPVWASNTSGNNGAYLAMQGDGNAVIIAASGRPVWATGTNGRGASTLVVQGDGNVVVKNGAGAALWASNTYKQVNAVSRFAANGWGSDQWSCLNQLFTRESRWNELARNSGSGAYGIPQSLPASKMQAAGSDYLTNPFTQIRWGLDMYIKPRYGSPCGAWSHELSTGWY